MQFTGAVHFNAIGLYNNNKKKSRNLHQQKIRPNPNAFLTLDFIKLNLKITV